MTTPRIVLAVRRVRLGGIAAFAVGGIFLLTAGPSVDSRSSLSAQTSAKTANPITGEGLPNPAPKVTRNWGELPAGRKWGTSAGLDVDPKDGNIWGYERCRAA